MSPSREQVKVTLHILNFKLQEMQKLLTETIMKETEKFSN